MNSIKPRHMVAAIHFGCCALWLALGAECAAAAAFGMALAICLRWSWVKDGQ